MQDICVGFEEDTFVAFLQKSVLADTDGNECEIQEITWNTVLPTLGSSCRDADFWEETTAELKFPFPEYATPAKLKLIYSFLEPGEGRSMQQGQIDITL